MKCFPDFVCIGTQKAGTTWLYHNLFRHTGVWLPPVKETHFLNLKFGSMVPGTSYGWVLDHHRKALAANLSRMSDINSPDAVYMAELLRQIDQEPDWYRYLFSFTPPGKITGEFTPDYVFLPPDGIRYLLGLNPNVRVLLICRDPVERDFSGAKMEAGSAEAQKDENLLKILDRPRCYERSDYPNIISRWASVLPAKNFLVKFYDEIETQPEMFLDEVAGFIGIEALGSKWAMAHETVFKGQDVPMSELIRAHLVARHTKTISRMCELYPEPGRRWQDRYH